MRYCNKDNQEIRQVVQRRYELKSQMNNELGWGGGQKDTLNRKIKQELRKRQEGQSVGNVAKKLERQMGEIIFIQIPVL